MMRLAFPKADTSEKRRDARAGCQRCRIRARPTRVPPSWKKSRVQSAHRYQYPSSVRRDLSNTTAKASSVTITVFSRAELSKSTAALMLHARCTTNPRASMSCAMVASGLRLDTKITVPARLSVCIGSVTLPDSTLRPLACNWP